MDDFVVDDLADGAVHDEDYDAKRDRKTLATLRVQDAFQPGATPFVERTGAFVADQADMRFLAYNAIGNITSREERSMSSVTGDADADPSKEDQDKIHIVQLNYADTQKHKASKFRDFFGFRWAALGAHGAVFASPRGWDRKEKKELPSTVFFRPSDSWDNKASSEWTLHLNLSASAGTGASGKEEVAALAIGDTFVAVATTRQYVRLVSHTGVQTFVHSMPGPIVSMVGQGGLLAVVYHDGLPLPGHQNLAVVILDVIKRRETFRGKCVITPRSTLTWIGFSDLGMLLSMDSYGVLRALSRSWGGAGVWTPVLETHGLRGAPGIGAMDSHWPVSVHGETLMAVLLPDGKKHPTAGKRSATQLISVPMHLPFLALDNPVAQHEEQHARHAILWHNDLDGPQNTASRWYSSKQEVEQDKLVLALFQRAAKGDFLARALDLATMLYKKKSLEVARDMATFEKKTALVSRLTMLLSVKFPAVAPRIDDDEGGVAAFLDLDGNSGSGAAAAGSSGPRRKLVRPTASDLDDAVAANARAADEDDGEEDYFAASKKGILKPSSQAPAASPFSSGASLSQKQKVQSANVKPKAPGALSQK
jgi:chromosome transmission fidelity protein 4